MQRFTDGEERWIVQRYTVKESLRKIAMEMQTSDATIKDVLARHGVSLRPPKTGGSPLTDEQQAEITRRLVSGEAAGPIARDMHIKYERVKTFLDRAGISRRAQNATKFDHVAESDIARRYDEGESPSEIAAHVGCSVATVRDIARRKGVAINPRGNNARDFTSDEVATMAALWREGMSQHAIGERFSASQVLVSRVLMQAGITKEQRRSTGVRSNLWKGGRTVTADGYVAITVPPDHPLASMRNRTGYILEHRLVMAQALGRPLLPTETIHHKDTNRANNDLSNLELRMGKHGKGAAFRCRCCGSYDVEAVDLADEMET